MKTLPFVLVCLSFVSTSAEKLGGQLWTNYLGDLSPKLHEYQSNQAAVGNNPFDEGFMSLLNTRPKSPPANTTLTTTCHTVTSTTSTPLLAITSEEPNGNDRLRRSILSDDTDIKSLFNIDDYDEKRLQALLRADPTVDGSGYTSEPATTIMTSSTSTTVAPLPELDGLSGFSQFVLPNIDPTNVNGFWQQFLARLADLSLTLSGRMLPNGSSKEIHTMIPLTLVAGQKGLSPSNLAAANATILRCIADSTPCDIPLTFNTSNAIADLTQLFRTLEDIARDLNATLVSLNRCENNQSVTVNNVTACYLIDLCRLCGTNPQRGVCLPQKNVSRCECFANSGDSSQSYEGEFCQKTPRPKPSVVPSWTPIVVGILASLAGLFLALAGVLLLVAIWRPGSLTTPSIPRLWNLPRANVPNTAMSEYPQQNPDESFPDTNSESVMSDADPSDPFDGTFFQDLDDQLNAKSTPTENYDPIHELDGVIDNEDMSALFHDALDQTQPNPEPFDAINPRANLSQFESSPFRF